MLTQEQKPACAEEGRVKGVDDGVENVYPGQCDVFEWVVGTANGGREPCDQAKDKKTVDVVGEL